MVVEFLVVVLVEIIGWRERYSCYSGGVGGDVAGYGGCCVGYSGGGGGGSVSGDVLRPLP